ncbi:DeoR/GlpR transcriptional regulator [Paenalkalicoccus suaedae]|uniref:DeoR/GlpR transcriptional regulator n=1 Tax=Paenalkalicoccus suaedae TaxID=2592382 RepID=A0A859FC57_9BACI|nr:DeoR/GlpR family DNA-binding transcription regulator [Paenalkalicoccus suaedae]QKS70144.1 DeoR/GlpR transcriptional regulator [Paenalkalicoccus suaedae]
MLTLERHERILALLKQQKIAKLHELVEATGASESTIRRDLSILEDDHKLKRIHGGASFLSRKSEEPSLLEKKTQHTTEKDAIGKHAASLVENNDCIYVDAGSTTEAILPHITAKNVTVVTNGLNIIEAALLQNLKVYVLAGYVKTGTRAFVGKAAAESIKQYRFDLAFIGTNGIDVSFGYSTPDPEEASIKAAAIAQSNLAYMVSDPSKFRQTSFTKIADLNEASLITIDYGDDDYLEELSEYTRVEAVKQ